MVADTATVARQMAAGIVLRLAGTLCASIVVIDEQGTPLAAGGATGELVPAAVQPLDESRWPIRVPVALAGIPTQVLIGAVPNGETLTPHHAQVIVQLAAEQEALVLHLPNRDELTDRLVLDLVHGTAGPDETVRVAQILGLDLERPRAVILVDAGDYMQGHADRLMVPDGGRNGQRGTLRARRLLASIISFLGPSSGTFGGHIGGGEIAVLKERDDNAPVPLASAGLAATGEPSWDDMADLKRFGDDLLHLLRRETGAAITVGLGRFHPGVAGLARSYRDAQTALLLGRRVGGPGRAYSLDDLGVTAFAAVAEESTRVALGRRVLAPLLREPDLIETLDAFFATDCSPSAASRRLMIHRNTLAYRLDRVALLTGLDPRRFDSAVQLRLALILHALQDEPMPLCNRPTPERSAR